MSRDQSIRILKGDSFQEIKQLRKSSVDLVVTSPPYNIGKEYETRLNLDEYLNAYREMAKDLHRVLKPDGNIAWQVGNYSENGALYPLDIFFYQVFTEAGFVLRNRIIWHFRHGMHAKYRLSGRYETIMWFAKDTRSVFNLDAIRIPNLYPGKRATKGPRKGQPSGNPLGKNPGDFWPDIAFEEWELGIFDIPNVKAHHPERTASHPCQFPVELVDRCILALSPKNGLVLDPFLGVGTSAISAMRHGRRFVGIERDDSYISAAKKRMAEWRAGTLRVREPGTPIATPKGKISQPPEEWSEDQ